MSEREKNAVLGYCEEPCNGPILARSRAYLAISHGAYWLWMRLPHWLAFGRFGYAILPRAGDVAFACTCRHKIDAAIRAARDA